MPDRWVVISLDGFATAALSAYGSSWNDTPAMDHMAAFGTLWDRTIVPSDDSIQVLRDLWKTAIEAQSGFDSRSSGTRRDASRTELFLNSGVQAMQLAKLAGSLGFDQCTLVEAIPEGTAELPETVEVEETSLARLILPVLERLGDLAADNSQAADWSLLWVHSDTLTRCWDAPRSLFPVDEEDDEEEDAPIDRAEWSLDDFEQDSGRDAVPPAKVKPPALFSRATVPYFEVPADSHPDLITSWMQTYGCQIRLLDRLIDLLLERIEATGENVGLAILGTSGFSLGQNGWIGHRAGPIRSPQIHVPAILLDRNGHGIRIPGARTLNEVSPWLCPVTQQHRSARPEPAQWADDATDRDAPVATESIRADRVLTTDQWFFVCEAGRSSLFLKPDDRDDCNDVADRCRDIVEDMETRS